MYPTTLTYLRANVDNLTLQIWEVPNLELASFHPNLKIVSFTNPEALNSLSKCEVVMLEVIYQEELVSNKWKLVIVKGRALGCS
jgi:hypothetical protein